MCFLVNISALDIKVSCLHSEIHKLFEKAASLGRHPWVNDVNDLENLLHQLQLSPKFLPRPIPPPVVGGDQFVLDLDTEAVVGMKQLLQPDQGFLEALYLLGLGHDDPAPSQHRPHLLSGAELATLLALPGGVQVPGADHHHPAPALVTHQAAVATAQLTWRLTPGACADEAPVLMNGLQPGGLLHTGQDVPRADLLAPRDVPLGPDLHHLGLWVDGVHGVTVAVAIHKRVQGIQGHPLNTALAKATGVDCLEFHNIDISLRLSLHCHIVTTIQP